MKQSVLTHSVVNLLLNKGNSYYRPRRTGERNPNSVRGCQSEYSLLGHWGEKVSVDIPGLTDTTVP